MIDIPEGARIVEACQHGNPMDRACKLCGRSADPDAIQTQMVDDPLAGERAELLAIAFGLLVGIDAKKAGVPAEWVESFEEWKGRYAAIDPRGTIA